MKALSSIHNDLLEDFLKPYLADAVQYDRISGYFCSSILAVAGPEFDHFVGEGSLRLVCNSKLQWSDIRVAKAVVAEEWRKQNMNYDPIKKDAANSQVAADWRSFNPRSLLSVPDDEKVVNLSRFERLYELLASKRLMVRVIPSNITMSNGKELSLLHGKAGVITGADGSETVFYTSANDSKTAWVNNYEMLCIAETEEETSRAKADFEEFWNHPAAFDLSECKYIMRDIHGLARDGKLDWKDWVKEPDPVSPFVLAPVDLMYHQQIFIGQVLREHLTPGGCRLVLADDVGLGKTLSLAGGAYLTFLADNGEKDVLIVTPPNLMRQWQTEIYDKLRIPSCYWNENHWITETDGMYVNPVTHQLQYLPIANAARRRFDEPPRKFIIVSSGLFTSNSENCRERVAALFRREYSCIILDEGHKVTRKNTPNIEQESDKIPRPRYGNLFKNLQPFVDRTHSFLLGTATPVQLHPVEASDLLDFLSNEQNPLLGSAFSRWHRPDTMKEGLDRCTREPEYRDEKNYYSDTWDWIRDPLPPASEGRPFETLRNVFLRISPDKFVSDQSYSSLSIPASTYVRDNICRGYSFFTMHNPYIRHIVRRSREALESTPNPDGVPYLKKIRVQTIPSDPNVSNFRETYDILVEFYQEIKKNSRNRKNKSLSSLVAEQLLRRVSSSLYAGRRSLINFVEKRMGEFEDETEMFSERKLGEDEFTEREWALLRKAYESMLCCTTSYDMDPKIDQIEGLLVKGVQADNCYTAPWQELGCILFSQYLDTAVFFAEGIHSRLPGRPRIGLYAGGGECAVFENGTKYNTTRDDLIQRINNGQIKILFATDAASEGLNLQMLSTLINIDLPWNPTRLSQRIGRIRRTLQMQPTVYVCNMRYKGTVEDKVYGRLCLRFEKIYDFFGSKPDYFEMNDIWDTALDPDSDAVLEARLDKFADEHSNPFQLRYDEVFKHMDKVSRGEDDWMDRDRYLDIETIMNVLRCYD